MRYMLDTNVLINCIRKRSDKLLKRLSDMDPSDVCISSLTYAELVHGVEKSKEVERNRFALALMLANFEILDFDVNAANDYGKIRADLESKGEPIGPFDMLIAAHALSRGCVLVTNNTREFQRVDGLKVVDWMR
ncbi:MAG: type II toxin-antitoxin system VapC family toxin [Clostridiales bacterium]|nr:type II toxin-antitoxin system VapC family toxin [Clostridiales bacterium]